MSMMWLQSRWWLLSWVFQCHAMQLSSMMQGAPYLLSSHACQAVFDESSNADFTCVVGRHTCAEDIAVTWSFVSHTYRYAILLGDNDKYGIWSTYSAKEYRSSLRIRQIAKDADVGLIECTAVCGSNASLIFRQSVELCILNAPTGLAFCGSSPANGNCMSAFGGSSCISECDSESGHYSGGSCRLNRSTGIWGTMCVKDQCAASFGDGYCNDNCSMCGADGNDCFSERHDRTPSDGEDGHCLSVLVATINGESTKSAVTAVHRALSDELNIPLLRVSETRNWSLSDNNGLVLYYINQSLFISEDGNKRSYDEVCFSMPRGECHQGLLCFTNEHNAAKYLANRVKLDLRTTWGARIAGIGVHGMKAKCLSRFYVEATAGDSTLVVSVDSLRKKMHEASIVGLALGIAAGMLLVGGVSYAAMCRQKTLEKNNTPPGVKGEASISSPNSLSAVGGIENEEVQALLLKTFSGQQQQQTDSVGSVRDPAVEMLLVGASS